VKRCAGARLVLVLPARGEAYALSDMNGGDRDRD
jgi:hypothetical protein